MQIDYRVDLYKLLPPNPVVVELGVAEGLNSYDMLQWGLSKLYMVDMWESNGAFEGDASFEQKWHNKNYEAAIKRVEKYKDIVEVLRGPTTKMNQYVGDETVDLVYIDACHSYRCVTNDLNAWYPKVKPGGVIAGHDFLNRAYGVKQAVDDFCRGKYIVHLIRENADKDAGFYFIKK